MASPEYITVPEFYVAWDRRVVEQITSDGGGKPEMDQDNLKAVWAIKRASDEVQMAATVGGRYTTTQLSTMDTDDRQALTGLVADLAMWHLFKRRAATMPESVRDARNAARDTLKDLRSGNAVFPIATARTAGQATVSIIPATTRAELNYVADSRFFGHAQDREY